MTTYVNPKMVEWFNEWQSTPDLLGVSIEEQKALLFTHTHYEFKIVWEELPPDKQTDELISWLYFFMSMYVSEIVFGDYKRWLVDITREDRVSSMDWPDFPDFGINGDMIWSIQKNYESNFKEPFENRGYTWWPFNFVEMSYPPTYSQLGGPTFEPILNWINENPFEVKQ